MKHMPGTYGYPIFWIVFAAVLVSEIPLKAQVGYPGGYPPGLGYPPYGRPGGGYPGGGGVPFPGGGRSKRSSQARQTYAGKLNTLDEKTIGIDLDDGRTITMQRSSKTKFYKDSKEIKAAELKTGDRISADGIEDQQGNLRALKITLVAKAADEQTKGDKAPQLEDERPKLKRGAPADAEAHAPLERQPAGAESSQGSGKNDAPQIPSSQSTQAAQTSGEHAPDPLIEKAREAAFNFSDKLPNFICQEYMARYQSYATASGWQPLDVVSADLVYDGGEESYKNLRINDHPTDRKIQELSGAWSTGEFATTLNDLFHPATATVFHAGGASPIAGVQAQVYDFTVRQETSHWRVQAGSQAITPSYQGSIWIDPENARVLRIEMQARALPGDFPMDTVESAVDYSWVRIGTDSVLLPVHAETLGCQRGTTICSRNIIDFRNYRKYSSDSKIIFDQ